MKLEMKKISHLVDKAKSHTKSRKEKGLSSGNVRHIPRITPDILRTCQKLGGPNSQVYAIDAHTIAKVGDHVRMAEAFAMKFIKEHTSVPVPTVLEAYIMEEGTPNAKGCIIMDRLPGEPLDQVWASYMPEQKIKIASQLRVIFDELRNFEGHHISSVDGSFCNDVFFTDSLGACGPFNSYEAFCDGIASALRAKRNDAKTELVIRFIKSIRPGRTLLTHNEFVPRNIMVHNGDVTGVVDWEKAGFFPEYWEYAKALFWPDWKSPWYKDEVIDQILQPYVVELGLLLHAKQAI